MPRVEAAMEYDNRTGAYTYIMIHIGPHSSEPRGASINETTSAFLSRRSLECRLLVRVAGDTRIEDDCNRCLLESLHVPHGVQTGDRSTAAGWCRIRSIHRPQHAAATPLEVGPTGTSVSA